MLDEQMNGSLLARFQAKVSPPTGAKGCREWTGRPDPDGYGRIRLGGTGTATVRAHRLSFRLEFGRWPEPNCLHECDNPPCVEPSHLSEGTTADNNADCRARGRHAPSLGEANGRAKLSDDDVRAIRASTARVTSLAREYGITHSAISNIRAGRRWKHLLGETTVNTLEVQHGS